MQGHLPQDEEQFVISHISPAYQSQSDYLRALAGLALMCFYPQQAFAPFFVFLNCVDMRLPTSLIDYKFLFAHVLSFTHI